MAGGLFVSIIWLIGQRLLVSFVIGDGYTAYGVVGSFIAIMLWAYYASAALFLGAEFVQALSTPPTESAAASSSGRGARGDGPGFRGEGLGARD